MILVLVVGEIHSQEIPDEYRAYREKYPEGPVLNRWDSLYLMNLPEKKITFDQRAMVLPPVVDNSTLPYLRPVFNQTDPSCGQAAMVGYNFTYEINCHRGLSSDTLIHQYPTHFSYNFMNDGTGWIGVSYFHSLEILRSLGCMNAADWGGMAGDASRWIDGYDYYYRAMHNRVRGFYSIRTGTEEGILALKHWLYDHMGAGEAGGVASYYANTPWNAKFLNDTTPEGGKHVITAWYPIASHAMTIVGYNDSIRWDYNGDGLYTNHLDLNGDGILDPRDWEIGAVKFVNSHGPGAQDSGFCYMMYKCLAENFEDGGVWNQAVHILEINPDYEPLVSYKVKLKHDNREKIKVLAGISTDTTDLMPQWTMDFPVINYQGGDYFMQGNHSEELYQYLEFGLDVTPLLDHAVPGEPVKFFLIVKEHDPFNEGKGEITSLSVMDHTLEMMEFQAAQTPVSLRNNGMTYASVVHSVAFGKASITTSVLPPLTWEEPYGVLIEAEGGRPPYDWDLAHYFCMETGNEPFPMIDGHQLLPNASQDTLLPVALGFGFPFYGEIYDTVFLHIDGHLQFDRKQLPWPYLLDLDLHLRSNRIIAPMTHNFFTVTPSEGDGAWHEAGDSSAIFRWKLSWNENPAGTDLNFAVKLASDGQIRFYYGEVTPEKGIPWIGGISAGNLTDYRYSPFSGSNKAVPGTTVNFFGPPFPAGFAVDEEGWLTGTPSLAQDIYDLNVRVTDQSGISSVKTLTLSSGPVIHYNLITRHDGDIHYGDTVSMDLEIINNGPDTLSNCSLSVASSDPYLQWLDTSEFTGSILPGETRSIAGAFSFVVSLNVPDQHDLIIDLELNSDGEIWRRMSLFSVKSPNLALTEFIIDDGDNGKLDPGETAVFKVVIRNSGHAPLYGVSGELSSLEPYAQVEGDPVQVFGMVGKGVTMTRDFMIRAENGIQEGLPLRLVFQTHSLAGLKTSDTISLRIGRLPVLIIDLDPLAHSGPQIHAMLNEMEVRHDYEVYIPPNLDDYQSLFVCLGYHNSNHALTWNEGLDMADYLMRGGRIHLEGKKTWKDDPVTPVHSLFNIAYNGNPLMLDTLVGLDSTFTEGLKLFNHAAYPFSFYHLEPIEPAFAILRENINLKPCAIAYDAGDYKTIGTLVELGRLAGDSTSAMFTLMEKYLEFFDIRKTSTSVEEVPGKNDGLHLTVYPNPAGRLLTVSGLSRAQQGISDQQPVLKAESEGSAVSISIYDLHGRKLRTIAEVTLPSPIDISGLPDGFYILRVISADGSAGAVRFIRMTR